MSNHVMIDLETLGNTPNAAFIALGAVVFDPNKSDGGIYEMPKTFYERVDWESACKGRSISPSTVKWWMQQSNDARAEILREGQPLLYVLESFAAWLPEDAIVWGNGATFDISILQDAYGERAPWKFWNVRDVRTVVDMAYPEIDRSQFAFLGTPHHALHDAIHQAQYVSAMWSALRTGIKGEKRDAA